MSETHFVFEGIVAANGEGLSIEMIGQELDRIRSGALQIADAVETLRGYKPTTAQIRAEWKQMKRKGG